MLHLTPIQSKARKCLSCGTAGMRAGRRYCSRECRLQMHWVLSLSKGLLKVFNARYAAFSFDHAHVFLDVLPVWAKEISRFLHDRTDGRKPAEDLKSLILLAGAEWYHMVDNRNSRSYASLHLLRKNHCKRIAPDSIKPNRRVKPRLSKKERESIRFLELKVDELLSIGNVAKIRSVYKKLAKIYHPDVGGDAEKFKKLNEAHLQMLQWVENPQFVSRKALQGWWSYDGLTNRWTPPL